MERSVAQRFPRDRLEECKCEIGESRTILFGNDQEPDSPVNYPYFRTPADVPLTTRYGGGTYSGARRSQQPLNVERTRFSSSVKHELFEKCRGICAGCLDNFQTTREYGNRPHRSVATKEEAIIPTIFSCYAGHAIHRRAPARWMN